MEENVVRDKLRQLIQQLAAGTEGGNIKWSDTGDANAFRAQFKGGMVRVQRIIRLDEEGHEVVDYSLILLDSKARELEDYYAEPSSEYALANLWILARRSARSTVDVLENLLREVNSGSTTGT